MQSMVSTIQKILANKSKKLFHPTRILRDADDILTKYFKTLIANKAKQVGLAFTSWKYYSFAKYEHAKVSVIYKGFRKAELYATQLIGLSVSSAFKSWAQFTKAANDDPYVKQKKYLYLYLSKFPQQRIASALAN